MKNHDRGSRSDRPMTFQKARTMRRLARRRGWQVPVGDPVRDPKTNRFPATVLHFSLDRKVER